MGAKRRRVGLLLGCVQREFLPQVNAATARVLAAEGCEVVAPAGQRLLRGAAGACRRGRRGAGVGAARRSMRLSGRAWTRS